MCVYRGTLRIGIDMSNLPVDWCKVQGKTVLLHLPDVGLLDGDFINDTRTTVFVQEAIGMPTPNSNCALKRRKP